MENPRRIRTSTRISGTETARRRRKDSIARTEGLGGGRTNTGGGRPKIGGGRTRAGTGGIRARIGYKRQPRPPHCGCTRRCCLQKRCRLRQFVPAAEAEVVELHERTPLSPWRPRDAKAERGVRSGSGEGKGGEGGGGGQVAEKEAEEEELAEDNWARHQRWGRDPRGSAGGRKRPTPTRTGRAKPGKGRGRASGRPQKRR
jgi:hypothetical protein